MSVTKYAGVAATALWTLTWLVPACIASDRLSTAHDSASLLCVIISGAFTILGCGMTIRFYKRIPFAESKTEPEAESASRRLIGWVAEFAWSAVAGVWNLGIEGLLIRAAQDGQAITLVISIPFSLIGWFLLLVRSVSIGVAIDSYFQRDEIVRPEP